MTWFSFNDLSKRSSSYNMNLSPSFEWLVNNFYFTRSSNNIPSLPNYLGELNIRDFEHFLHGCEKCSVSIEQTEPYNNGLVIYLSDKYNRGQYNYYYDDLYGYSSSDRYITNHYRNRALYTIYINTEKPSDMHKVYCCILEEIKSEAYEYKKTIGELRSENSVLTSYIGSLRAKWAEIIKDETLTKCWNNLLLSYKMKFGKNFEFDPNKSCK